jgi:hypothetical protein
MAFTEGITFRPRNGLAAECYWRIRKWCDINGFSMSDVLNALMPPVAYYLENHCHIDEKKQMAMVELNVGHLPIYHVLANGRVFPLRKDTLGNRGIIERDKIDEAIAYWKQRNDSHPTVADLQLLDAKVQRAT